MNKAIIYTRVSTDEQAKNGLSLDGQLRACQDYAVHNDLEVARVFREEGESAKTTKRPQLMAMLDYCQKNKGQTKNLIIFKVDRLARQAEDHLIIKAALKKVGVTLISVTEPIEDTTTGRLMETMLAGFAQFDNEVRAERSTGGMVARIEQGGWPFVAPIGYRNKKDSSGRPTLEPDQKSAAVASWLRKFATGNYTQLDMHELAPKMGVTNKANRPLSPQMVSNMLRNPVYAGVIASKMIEGTRPGLHAALITRDEYKTIQSVLEGRRRVSIMHATPEVDWPLRGGFVRCSICTTPITGSIPRGRSARYPKYSCPKCRRSTTGKQVSENKEELHRQFLGVLEHVTPTQDKLKLFREITLRRWNEDQKNATQERRSADKKLDELRSKRQRVVDLFIDEKLSIQEKSAQTAIIDSEITKLDLIRNEARTEEIDKEVLVDYAINFITNAPKLWTDANPVEKRRFQMMIFPEGITYDFGVGFGTARLGLCYEIIQDLSKSASAEPKSMVGLPGFEPGTKRL